VRPQSMGRTVGELEAQGLIERSPDPSDGRRFLIELTDAGRTELYEDRGRREGWLAEAIEQSFTAEERETLDEAVRLMARLAEL
ncbi:MAG: MarR family winged helix-turn-helix transcriptional regulator, partial [Thermoleophilia bacterium]